jgi:molybdate transport system substrate-binding protein
MKRWLPVGAIAAIVLSLSAPRLAGAETLTVAVAANLQYVFDDLRANFRSSTGHELKPVFNSSGKFVAQIMNGAPFDVFLSADMEFPEKLHQQGFTAGPARAYAYGALVLWTMRDLDMKNWQSALLGPAFKRIAIANPATAPYGRETIKALRHLKLDAALKDKLVFGESIAQTNQYIHSRAADAGFTAKSVVVSPAMKGQGSWVELPQGSYQPIAQGAVILRHGKQENPRVAQQFYDYLFSADARAIFQRYGYLLP